MRGLQKISARYGLLPKSYLIARSSLSQPDVAFSATGRISGTCKYSMGGELVAVKTINSDCIGNFNAFKQVRLTDAAMYLSPMLIPVGFLQRLCTSAVMWRRVRHPNVVSFHGLGSDSPPFSLVYPWMPNGTLSEYLRKHPNVNKLGLVRIILSAVGNLLNESDPQSMPAVGCRSRVGIPAPVQSGSW